MTDLDSGPERPVGGFRFERTARAIACVNALRGVSDPAAFVAAALRLAHNAGQPESYRNRQADIATVLAAQGEP